MCAGDKNSDHLSFDTIQSDSWHPYAICQNASGFQGRLMTHHGRGQVAHQLANHPGADTAHRVRLGARARAPGAPSPRAEVLGNARSTDAGLRGAVEAIADARAGVGVVKGTERLIAARTQLHPCAKPQRFLCPVKSLPSKTKSLLPWLVLM